MMQPRRRAETLDRGLGGQEQAEHVEVEYFVELFGGYLFERGELVDAGVVDQDIERGRKRLFGLG